MASSQLAPLFLYTPRLPGGIKLSILLEAVYGDPNYEAVYVDLSKNVQKEPWFIKVNPNGRAPALTDRSRGDLSIFDSGAITLYLAQHYDKARRFSFDPVKDADEYIDMVQWTFFANTGLGLYQGEAEYFFLSANEDVPYAKNRYLKETKRLYGVLENRLKDRDYFAGPGRGKYTLADINVFPWIDRHALAVDKALNQWPNLKAWLEKLRARLALQIGKVV